MDQHTTTKQPWSTYRMWRQAANGGANAGSSAMWLGEWTPTEITFRARSQQEAQEKANKFWREAQLGFGGMVCVPADEDLRMQTANQEGK